MRRPLSVFLAHASEDKAVVRDIYVRLKEAGFAPWMDEVDLIAGQDWQTQVLRGIQDCDAFVACMSKRALQKQGYLQKEFRYALSLYAEKLPGSIYFIPLKLDECEVPDLQIPQLGIFLHNIQWLDYWKPDGFEQLAGALLAGSRQLHSADRPEFSTLAASIAAEHHSVESVYVFDGGRDIRVIAKPEWVDDLAAVYLAKDIARKVQLATQSRHRIKVSVIRLTYAVEYAGPSDTCPSEA